MGQRHRNRNRSVNPPLEAPKTQTMVLTAAEAEGCRRVHEDFQQKKAAFKNAEATLVRVVTAVLQARGIPPTKDEIHVNFEKGTIDVPLSAAQQAPPANGKGA